MKHYYLESSATAKYGWLFVEDDDGQTKTTELRSKTTDNYLRFPENDYGQKMICMKKLEGLDRYDLEPYQGRHRGGTASEPKTDLLDALALCLDANDRLVFIELCNKARERFKILKRKELLEKQIAKFTAELESLAE